MKEKMIVKNILSYIEENLYEDLSLDDIEKKLCYSKFYLNRVFAKEVGCTIYKYVQMRRLTEGARQLAKTDRPIVQIAQDVHYNSQQAFTQAFRRVYLCTPQEYRRRGVFDPKQPKITMSIISSRNRMSSRSRISRGRLAAKGPGRQSSVGFFMMGGKMAA